MAEEELNMTEPSAAELQQFDLIRMQAENVFSETWADQHRVEESVFLIRQQNKLARDPEESFPFYRQKHISWLLWNLGHLPKGSHGFDALQGWVAFWITHALDLLKATIPSTTSSLIVSHFRSCVDVQKGGYGGGPRQIAHLACTFSSFMALCALGTDEALASVDVEGLRRFLLSVKQADGSFRVSEGGECDVRAMYCALAVASITGLLEGESAEELTQGCAAYVKSLQSFDGGLGGEPGAEAHGGNTYCGLATLAILGQVDAIDRESLLDWAVMRQMGYEGGFQGRTNKLVDSCYSFWVGSLFPILAMQGGSDSTSSLFDAEALQRYVLECCQMRTGGFRDKPGAAKDFMHTCYALSGLSVAQHVGGATHDEVDLKRINPVYNLSIDRFDNAWTFFRTRTP